MNKSTWTWGAACLLLIATATVSVGCSASTSGAGTAGADTFAVGHAWVEPQNDGEAAVFGLVMNLTSSEATAISATSAAAGSVELHETTQSADGSSLTAEAPGGFRIPAGQSLTLEPGGAHLRLMELVHPLQPGDEVTIDLTLEDGSASRFVAAVKAVSDPNEIDGAGE